MEFKVLLVDDEPGALRFLQHIIEDRCPGWRVAGTAENGRQALVAIQKDPPDMVLTDIRMPVVDGIELARGIQQSWPDVRTVVISGYEDFSAAQNAMRYGVSDYLLKPVNPTQLVELLEKAHGQIRERKWRGSVQMLAAAVSGEAPDAERLARSFPGERFVAALVRAGPLPSRFSGQFAAGLRMPEHPGGSLPEYSWLIAGRDESELFVFQAVPSATAPLEELARLAGAHLGGGFHTVAYHRGAFALSAAGEVVSLLLRAVYRSLVLGVSRTVEVENALPPHVDTRAPVDAALEQQVTGLCAGVCRTRELRELVWQLFDTWQAEQRPLYRVQRDLARLLRVAEDAMEGHAARPADHEHQLEEAILLSADYTALRDRVWNLMLAAASQAERQDAPPGSEAFFGNVRDYIEQNLTGAVTMQTLCAAMGISQTYMSRIFRRNTGLSFSEYLTARRMTRAKGIMREKPDLPLKTIAELSGYKDPLYFSKVFRAAEGMPPSRYIGAVTQEGE